MSGSLAFQKFLAEDQGQDGVEYALLIGFVVALCMAGIPAVLDAMTALWTAMNNQLSNPG